MKTVSYYLNNEETVEKWHVDTDSRDKVLSVAGNQLNEERVITAVQQVGFDIEKIS